jgi:hypothetical protein
VSRPGSQGSGPRGAVAPAGRWRSEPAGPGRFLWGGTEEAVRPARVESLFPEVVRAPGRGRRAARPGVVQRARRRASRRRCFRAASRVPRTVPWWGAWLSRRALGSGGRSGRTGPWACGCRWAGWNGGPARAAMRRRPQRKMRRRSRKDRARRERAPRAGKERVWRSRKERAGKERARKERARKERARRQAAGAVSGVGPGGPGRFPVRRGRAAPRAASLDRTPSPFQLRSDWARRV